MIDLFNWSNSIDAHKGDLQVEVFLFNKNYTPYATSIGNELFEQLKPVFLFDIINYVTMGAAANMSVRPVEDATKEKGVVYHEERPKVGRADTVIHLIENERDDILQFSDDEHDFKRMKGIVARFTHPTDESVNFYVIKLIDQAAVVKQSLGWQFANDSFDTMKPAVAFRPPTDNQVLIIDGDIFIFDAAKFTRLFNHDARALKEANRIGALIDEQYELSMPTIGQGIAFMAQERPSLINKLIQVEPGRVSQQDVIETADKLAIELMVDDAGKIILMDVTDVAVFLDILLDNYYSSDATGTTYVAKSKKLIAESEDA